MKTRFTLIAISAVFAIAILCGLYISAGPIIALGFRANNIDISYKQFSNKAFRQFVFKDFSAVARDRKVGFAADQAVIAPRYPTIFKGGLVYDFKFTNFRFVSDQPGAAEKLSENLDAVISLPFSSRWAYMEVLGAIQRRKDGIHVERLLAVSPMIKLEASGSFANDHKLNMSITMYFKKELFSILPDDWSKVVLKNEGEDWQSLAVEIKGDLSKPSIQMTGNLFRLTIREK